MTPAFDQHSLNMGKFKEKFRTHVFKNASKGSNILTIFYDREEMITNLPFSDLQRSADGLGGNSTDAAGHVSGRRHE